LKTILILDDEEVVRKVVRAMLEGQGYRVLEASEGAEALRLLGEERPDLILVDLTMPGMSGIKFVETLRKQVKMPVPFIILTGTDPSEIDIEKLSEALGARSILQKPFSRDELLEKIEGVLK
jgi:CheY-like chemotaxis protein